MGTIHAKALIEKAGVTLADTEHVRYTTADLLKYLNDGQREIILVKPEASSALTEIGLHPGTLQMIPDDGISFLRLTRNLGEDGLTPGAVITGESIDDMDAIYDWHTRMPSNTVLHYIPIKGDPKHFYVYPPIPDTASVYAEIIYSTNPVDVVIDDFETSTDSITLDDIYANALLDYMLFKAYSTESEGEENSNRALMHNTAFYQSIGFKGQAEKTRKGKR